MEAHGEAAKVLCDRSWQLPEVAFSGRIALLISCESISFLLDQGDFMLSMMCGFLTCGFARIVAILTMENTVYVISLYETRDVEHFRKFQIALPTYNH